MILGVLLVTGLLALVFFAVFVKPHKPSTASPTQQQVNRLYEHNESFTNWLPWLDFDEASQQFLLEDGVSVGAMFELSMLPTEAKPERYLKDIEANFRSVLTQCIPEQDTPYILQFYVQDQDNLDDFVEAYDHYFPSTLKKTPFTQHFIQSMKSHCQRISHDSGYFKDETVTGAPWYAKQRKVRLFLYKRIHKADAQDLNPKYKKNSEAHYAPSIELNEVAEKLVTQLQASGLTVRRCDESDFVRWMLAWFNPQSESLIKPLSSTHQCSTEDIEQNPYGYDLSRLLNLSTVSSQSDSGAWYFDGMPHRFICVDGLRRSPKAGHLTGERKQGEHHYALFDRLPKGSMGYVSIVIQPQDAVQNHLSRLQAAAKGESAQARLTGEDAERALYRLQQGDALYPTTIGIFVRAADDDRLKTVLNNTHALLIANGLSSIAERNQLVPLDAYLRCLPMAYEPQRDKVLPLNRYLFTSHIARLLPLWGRGRGTGHPGLVFYNRGAEPLTFDPLNPKDRSSNAFGLILGPPGSGKSALMVYILMQFIARYNARIFICEKGGSFKLVGDHCQRMGLSVNSVFLHHKYDVSLPPFANALRMLEVEEAKQQALDRRSDAQQQNNSWIEKNLDNFDPKALDEHIEQAQQPQDLDEDEERDYLGEMELSARLMITGGEQKEEDKLSRADRLLIRHSIVNAAIKKREENKKDDIVIISDVVEALRELGNDSERRESSRSRAHDMADAMELFTQGVQGHFFNRQGSLWPESDVTILELGIFSQDAYKDGLGLAFTSLMNIITAIAERDQHQQRPIILIGDEIHLVFEKPSLAVFFVKFTKMMRKLGLWPWLSTQNLQDFSGDSRKMLSMMEWFIAMTCPREQIELISEFKDLTEEQKQLLLAAHKEPGKYTEGVVMGKKLLALFRNVPPPIALALAQTEKHEKVKRAKIMKEKNFHEEIDAAYEVANEMIAKKEQEMRDAL